MRGGIKRARDLYRSSFLYFIRSSLSYVVTGERNHPLEPYVMFYLTSDCEKRCYLRKPPSLSGGYAPRGFDRPDGGMGNLFKPCLIAALKASRTIRICEHLPWCLSDVN